MSHNHAPHQIPGQHTQKDGSFWRSRYSIGLLVIGAVAGYFLWTEHRAHLSQWWPYAILLLCPLMHVFMHGGHGGHGGNANGQTSQHDDDQRRS
jgi:hypothetical protein